MSENIINKIENLLNEEKWTRATLGNYTIANFKELDVLVKEIIKEECEIEIKQICDEHLEHTKNSIIALYISGIIALKRQLVDDSNLLMLIKIFGDNHKLNIVEYLSNRILEFGENKYALRVLADCYDTENQQEEKNKIWERLIRVDYEEAEIVNQLAELSEEKGDIEEAISLYKKAIHRYINKKLFNNVRETWNKFIKLNSGDVEFFFQIEKKIAKTISAEKSIDLLEELYPVYTDSEDWDTAIVIIKRILKYDIRNEWARKQIIKCFRNKYADHSQLEEYIRVSNLNDRWRNAAEAIADFEKHISFDAGNFVSHKAWGVGIIKSIKDDTIVIDFIKKRGHSMSLKMAVSSLMSLPNEHIWVLKGIWSKEKLKGRIKKEIPWALKVLIKSFNNSADMKKIKAEIVPSILTPGEWSTWSTEARKILKTDSAFGNMPDKVDQYVVRDKPISFEEKTSNRFKAENDFFARLLTINEFLENAEPDSDYFLDMFSYFTSFLKAANVNEQVLCSFLYVQKLAKTYPFLNPGINYGFKEVFDDIGDFEEVENLFKKIDNTDLRKDFLIQIKKNIDNWPEYYVRLFPICLSRQILIDLDNNGYTDEIYKLISDIISHYREYREAFIWVAKNAKDTKEDNWFSKLDISFEKILINMIHLLDISYRDVSTKKYAAANRKINRSILNFLFKENTLEEYILQSSEDSVTRLFSLLQDVKELDPSIKIDLKQKIVEKYPNIQFYGKKEEVVISPVSRGIFCLEASLVAKKKELKNILEVEVPKNSKEIGIAIEMGDLKENAEYKAGKEKQEALNIAVGKLKDEIERAKIFDFSQVDFTRVSFGTIVKLQNITASKEETYTILGPWESNPSNNVISYLSPFGNELLGGTAGTKLNFIINEREFSYEILSVDSAV
jgi:transcription elongation factor GreA-like protein/transcription elongation GreA/GreB family factor